MIQEARDEEGNWRPIEFWNYSDCAHSYGAIGILPNNCVVAKVLKYQGDFETEIRVKLRNGNKVFYSNSFVGSINIKQFDLPEDYKTNILAHRMNEKDYLDKIFLDK